MFSFYSFYRFTVHVIEEPFRLNYRFPYRWMPSANEQTYLLFGKQTPGILRFTHQIKKSLSNQYNIWIQFTLLALTLNP